MYNLTCVNQGEMNTFFQKGPYFQSYIHSSK